MPSGYRKNISRGSRVEVSLIVSSCIDFKDGVAGRDRMWRKVGESSKASRRQRSPFNILLLRATWKYLCNMTLMTEEYNGGITVDYIILRNVYLANIPTLCNRMDEDDKERPRKRGHLLLYLKCGRELGVEPLQKKKG